MGKDATALKGVPLGTLADYSGLQCTLEKQPLIDPLEPF